jgi:hypothetical protein
MQNIFAEHRVNFGLRARRCQCGLKVPCSFNDVAGNRSVLQDKKAKAASRATLRAARYSRRIFLVDAAYSTATTRSDRRQLIAFTAIRATFPLLGPL